MTSIPVNAFSAPHVRQVMQKQKLLDQQKNRQAKLDQLSSSPSQISNARKSAPDCLDAHHADLVNQQNFLDTFKNIIPNLGRKDLIGRSISCTEPRMEIQIEIKDFSSDDINSSSKSPNSSSNTLSPMPLGVEKKRFRFLSGQ